MTTSSVSLDADRLCARAREFVVSSRFGAARPLLAALRRIGPPSARIAELSAMLAIRTGELASARTELDEAVASWPDDAGVHLQRSALSRLEGDNAAALDEAAQAVILAPLQPHAKAMLGTALLDVGQAEDACVCLADSLASEPGNTLFRLALSDAQVAAGDIDAAESTLQEGIRRAPSDTACRKAAMLIAVQNNRFESAVACADTAREEGVVDAIIYGLAGHALSKLGRHDEAGAYYSEARKLGPDDPYVRHLVAAAGGLPSLDAASPEYVRAVFNDYAPTFEAHLIALGYRAPGLIRAALERHSSLAAGRHVGPLLDLGCGTGLMAVALLNLPAGPLVGVDLSPRMLERASAKGLYESVHQEDISAFLSADAGMYAGILAADVFCYLGDLAPVLSLARDRLVAGGLCIFSVEMLTRSDPDDGRGWHLGQQGRYRHTADHVRAAASRAGLTVLELSEEPLRHEANAPVGGLIAVCRAP